MPSTPEQGPLLDTLSTRFSADDLLKPGGEEAVILETYRPLGQSLDWELGQLFYRCRGNTVFLNGEVPYLVNNDGVLAARAAAVFFTSLEERAGTHELTTELRVLEFGGGSCLFARGFLLAFERLSEARQRDYHKRLTYVLADHSEPMLDDARRAGVFPPNCSVTFARADAVQQRFEAVQGDVPDGTRFDAIFLNYLLDCLPATVLRRHGDTLEQLCIQTELPPGNRLFRDLPGAQDRATGYSTGANSDRSGLIDLYPIFRLRCRYEPVREADVPLFRAATQLLDGDKPLLHSYAAIACLDASIRKLQPGGFVLFSDYGARNGDPPQDFTRLFHQHFGSSTAIGLNLQQLRDYATAIPGIDYAGPPSDDESLTVRLAGMNTSDRVTTQFRQLFDRDELERLRAPRRLARQYRGAGAHQLALECYWDAIRVQPENWDLKGEVALFCEMVLHLHDKASELAKAALELNPIDPDLWNTLGDSLYSMGHKDEAETAFRWALQLSPANVRGRYNLVYTLTDKGDLTGALKMIAEALAADKGGEFTDRLLKRQREIIGALKQRRQRITEAMADRYVGNPGLRP